MPIKMIQSVRGIWLLTLVPAAVFGDVCWVFFPSGVFRVLEHIATKIPTAILMFFLGQTFIGATSRSRDVDIRHKSKMAVAEMKCTHFMAVWLMSEFKCPQTKCIQKQQHMEHVDTR